jgi:lipopolysaccharide transport system permease protein
VRYKQSVLGAAWALLQPLLMMVIFSFIFGRLAQMPSEGVPYPLFFLAGFLPWNFFAQALSFSANSLVNNANLVTKIYFPRLILPITPILASMVDFLIAGILLVVMIPYYSYLPSANIWLLPVMFLWILLSAMGAGMLLAALTVKYRDFRHIIPFIIQLGLYVTPVVYPAGQIPAKWHFWWGFFNPMAGAISGFRWALLGTGLDMSSLLIGSTVSVLLLNLLGLYYFRRTERFFADVI